MITTFLVIFFLQNAQNFAVKVTHLKLDELMRAIEGARSEIVSAEQAQKYETDALGQITVEQHKDAQLAQQQ